MKIPFRRVKDGITIEVKVEPRASTAGIQGVMEGVLKVRLTSPPVDGAANKQLIELLAKELKIKKGAFTIMKGEKSKNKVVKITGVDSL